VLGDRPARAREIERLMIGVQHASISRDGKTIVFDAVPQVIAPQVHLLDVDRAKLVQLTDDPGGGDEPSLSPDGQRLAYTHHDPTNREVYMVYPVRDPPLRPIPLTQDPADDSAPAWSPDGKTIAFVSTRMGRPRVFVMNADGSAPRPAHDGDASGDELAPSWSPDGALLGYTVSTRDGASEIWAIDAATHAAHRVSAPGARDEDPSWAPDGKHLVYVSTRDQRIDLWVARADGAAESRLTDTPLEEVHPCWRP